MSSFSDTFFTETYYLNGTVPLLVEFGIENGDVSSAYISDVRIEGPNGEFFSFDDLTKIGVFVRTLDDPLGTWKDLETILLDWSVDFYDSWEEDMRNTYTERDEEG